MAGMDSMRIRVTLRWLQILDNLEPFFKSKGEFVFHAKVWTSNHGGKVEETRLPAKGHYPISDHPRWNRLKDLDKVLFEGEVTDHLVVELRGEELDQLSKNDQLESYSRKFEGARFGAHRSHPARRRGFRRPGKHEQLADRLRDRGGLTVAPRTTAAPQRQASGRGLAPDLLHHRVEPVPAVGAQRLASRRRSKTSDRSTARGLLGRLAAVDLGQDREEPLHDHRFRVSYEAENRRVALFEVPSKPSRAHATADPRLLGLEFGIHRRQATPQLDDVLIPQGAVRQGGEPAFKFVDRHLGAGRLAGNRIKTEHSGCELCLSAAGPYLTTLRTVTKPFTLRWTRSTGTDCALGTEFLEDVSRSVVARNRSPDVPFEASVNPYRGCEHGCVYCYARPTHEQLGFSSGLEFERKILIKRRAPELLREALSAPSWRPQVVCMSGVTDPYQPAERRFRLTRGCLQVLRDFRNPVGIVTKNHLATRDLDLLSELARSRLRARLRIGDHVFGTTCRGSWSPGRRSRLDGWRRSGSCRRRAFPWG